MTELAGRSVDALAVIEHRLVDKALRLAIGEDDFAYAWGQYLDERAGGGQWGIFGTSAGAQTLALIGGTGPVQTRLDGALKLLPADLDRPPTALESKIGRGQMQNIFRLAAIAEALQPDEAGPIGRDRWPPVVSHIFELGDPGHSWEPESALPGHVQGAGDPFTTAFVAHALRRYEARRELEPHRTWLAHQLERESVHARPDYVALIGLALVPLDPSEVRDDVRRGLDRAAAEILAWRKAAHGLVVDRPIFFGYRIGDRTDYIFTNPEMLASLFFLRWRNPRSTRRFVVETVAAVEEGVDDPAGFIGQPGTEITFDQLWAARLLQAFHAIAHVNDQRHRVRPPWVATQKTWWLLFLAVAAVGVAAAVLLGGEGSRVAAVLFALAAVLTAIAIYLSRGADDV